MVVSLPIRVLGAEPYLVRVVLSYWAISPGHLSTPPPGAYHSLWPGPLSRFPSHLQWRVSAETHHGAFLMTKIRFSSTDWINYLKINLKIKWHDAVDKHSVNAETQYACLFITVESGTWEVKNNSWRQDLLMDQWGWKTLVRLKRRDINSFLPSAGKQVIGHWHFYWDWSVSTEFITGCFSNYTKWTNLAQDRMEMQAEFLQAVLYCEPCTPVENHEHGRCRTHEFSVVVATQEPHNTETGKNISMGGEGLSMAHPKLSQ